MSERKFVQAKHFTTGPRKGPIELIVIHDMEYPERPTGAEWCADFFAGRNGLAAPQASAHYCVDNDSIVQSVRDEDVAWHAPGANHNGIGIEHAGYARQSAAEWQDAYSTAMLELSAELAAELCHRYGVPAERPSVAALKAGARGIVGHKDCSDAWKPDGHHDPGPGFPWEWYLTRVRHHLALLTGEATADVPDVSSWPVVDYAGERWAVAPVYVPFVGIGQAEEVAARLGCELPTPGLVDAIWRAADLKLDATRFIRAHDGTPATMASVATFEDQGERIARQIGGRALGVDFTLLTGCFKDVVNIDGKPGLYGAHRLDGTVIQPPYTGHARGWIDYFQGLRLCRRVNPG